MEHKLSYRNEDDKCYGATGMAVAVVVFDGEDKLAALDLDADADAMLEFAGDFYFSGNPGLSAKAAWNHILKNFNLEMAVTIANVMCRHMVLDRTNVSPQIKKTISQCVFEEGHRWCNLDDDEINRLFEKNYTYLFRVFNHRGVQDVVRDFADVLKRRRRLSRFDVVEQLRALSML